MPDQRDVPETNPDEEPTPALGPVEQPLAEQPADDPEPIELPEGLAEDDLEPIELPDEEAEPIDLPDEDEPAAQLIEVVRDLEQRLASNERDLAELMATIPVPPPDDFFARSEPPAGPDEIAGPVQLRGGAGIDSIFTASGGSFGTTPPFTPQMAVGAEEIEWGIAALPSNRPDTCAWLRPEVAGSYGYCYVVPTDPPTSSVLDTPGAAAISAEGEDGFVKVTFWGAGFAQPQEPNVRGGQLIPFIRVGGIAMGIGYLDRPLGTIKTVFDTDITNVLAEGWIVLFNNSDTDNMPNTDVTTLGAEITNTDVQRTLFVGAGDQDFAGIPADEEFPNAGTVGTVAAAFAFLIANGSGGTAFASYFIAAQRVN